MQFFKEKETPKIHEIMPSKPLSKLKSCPKAVSRLRSKIKSETEVRGARLITFLNGDEDTSTG